jgi:DNA-directed RNA polymerase specialized sigma24 family protein
VSDTLLRLRARVEERANAHLPEPVAGSGDTVGPEDDALVADSVGPALLANLEKLTPAERVALVVHDVFGVPIAEITPVVGCSSNATKSYRSPRSISPDSKLISRLVH